MIHGTTRLYAIIGDPIEHVRTPTAFNKYFSHNGIDAVCLPIHIARSDLKNGWKGLKLIRNLDGFIVTAPHKVGAGDLCDTLDGDGARTRVVNTVRRERDGSYTGTLLDGHGFVRGLRTSGHEVKAQRVYVAGAGGAGEALAFALADCGVSALTIHNRTQKKARALVERVAAVFPTCDVKVGTENAGDHDLIVNATTLGLNPDDEFSFDLASASPRALIAEVVMKPEFTPLLLAAKQRGHEVHSGIHMLSGQLEMMMAFFGLSGGSAQDVSNPQTNSDAPCHL